MSRTDDAVDETKARAWDYAVKAKDREAKLRELLRWALTFVTNETDALAECHENPATGEIEPQEVAEEVAEARAWIEGAKGVVG